ncbi:MAG: ABC transporter substrate-binding protein [Natrialbaceae archaeon]|nr:ABC transporter substrate-binding protein [Natrialbaceae archaeon]
MAIETIAQTVFPQAGSATDPDAYAESPESTHGCQYPITLTDATGTDITLSGRPDSIVALQASDARTLYEIGAWDRVVGYPMNPATASLPAGDRVDISEGYATDTEQVVDLDPDVVLAANVTFAADYTQLRSAGLTLYHFNTATALEDIVALTKTTGNLAGTCEGANETARWMEDRIANVTASVDESRTPLGHHAQGGGWTAGPQTFQHDVLETAGLENLAARTGQTGWIQLGAEFIIEQDPSWIAYADTHSDPPIAESVEYTTAVQEGNFVTIDPNNMSQPAPTIIYPLEQIAQTVDPALEDQFSLPHSRASSPAPSSTEPAVMEYESTALSNTCRAPTYPIEVTDGSETVLTLDQRPERIVALQASDARTLHAIGAWDRWSAIPRIQQRPTSRPVIGSTSPVATRLTSSR